MSCDCNTLVIEKAGVQGPQGFAGINGSNGTNGINASTTSGGTSANQDLIIYLNGTRYLIALKT